ncbi:MAG: DUF948 domain-containing protein [Streptosporangiaceae bacterium]
MNAGQLAALIAAGFFAVVACTAVYVLARVARLVSAATALLSDYRDRTDQLVLQAQAAVDRTSEQLARTDSITASMDQVTTSLAELSGHVSSFAGLARALSAGFGAPLARLPALAYGVGRAVGVRRSARLAAAQPAWMALPGQRDGAAEREGSRQ